MQANKLEHRDLGILFAAGIIASFSTATLTAFGTYISPGIDKFDYIAIYAAAPIWVCIFFITELVLRVRINLGDENQLLNQNDSSNATASNIDHSSNYVKRKKWPHIVLIILTWPLYIIGLPIFVALEWYFLELWGSYNGFILIFGATLYLGGILFLTLIGIRRCENPIVRVILTLGHVVMFGRLFLWTIAMGGMIYGG